MKFKILTLIMWILLIPVTTPANYIDYDNSYRGEYYDSPEEREAARRAAVMEDRYARDIDPYHVTHPNLEDY